MKKWLAVAVVALLLVGGYALGQSGKVREAASRDTAAEDALAAASEAITAMTTYDHQNVDADFEWVDTAGTDHFQEQFAEASEPAKELIVRKEATAESEVLDAAAVVEDAEHVRVILFVDQLITTPEDEEGKLDQTRVSMEMVKSGDEWLVDKVLLNNRPAAATLPQ